MLDDCFLGISLDTTLVEAKDDLPCRVRIRKQFSSFFESKLLLPTSINVTLLCE